MTTRADEVGGFRVPRGDIVILVPYVTHRHPDFWVNAHEFEPTRFLAPGQMRSIAGPTFPSAQDIVSASEWILL
jgi:cytochrome P450